VGFEDYQALAMEVLHQEAGTASDGLVTFEESAIPASTDADETEPWTPEATSKEVVFTIEADHAAQVQVMGDFNDWNLEGSEMERVDGVWQKVVTLQPGGSGGVQGSGRPAKSLGRGLEDGSHLFLSHKTDRPNDRPTVHSNDHSVPPPPSRAGVTLLRPATVTKDWLTIVLTEFGDAVEDGLRTIDANVPCHPCGEIDLLAVDRTNHLTIIDFDTTANDGLLLRGMGHFDWIVR